MRFSTLLLTLPLFTAATAMLTHVARSYAVRRAVLDIPVSRSSHGAPMPRGGGISFVVAVLAASIVLGLSGSLDPRAIIGFAGGGGAVAAIGWVDDHRATAARTRLIVHLAAALWFLAWSGGAQALYLFSPRATYLGPAGWILAALGLVWLANLYNFMDGIDGLAAAEAVTVGSVIGAVLWENGAHAQAAISLITAAAAAGFLSFNWPPARIFMGDVGSGFLGFAFGAVALLGSGQTRLPIALLLLPLGVFILDATFTLARRIVRRENPLEAHHSHIYQRLVGGGWTHTQVTAVVILVNTFLAGITLAAATRPELTVYAVAVGGMLVLGVGAGCVALLPRRAAVRSTRDTVKMRGMTPNAPSRLHGRDASGPIP